MLDDAGFWRGLFVALAPFETAQGPDESAVAAVRAAEWMRTVGYTLANYAGGEWVVIWDACDRLNHGEAPDLAGAILSALTSAAKRAR